MQQETIHHLPNILEREERKFLGNPKSMQKIYEETLDKVGLTKQNGSNFRMTNTADLINAL